MLYVQQKINKFYSDIVEDDCIFDKYNEKWVNKMIDKMTENNPNITIKERNNRLLYLDDVVCDHNLHQSPSF